MGVRGEVAGISAEVDIHRSGVDAASGGAGVAHRSDWLGRSGQRRRGIRIRGWCGSSRRRSMIGARSWR